MKHGVETVVLHACFRISCEKRNANSQINRKTEVVAQ